MVDVSLCSHETISYLKSERISDLNGYYFIPHLTSRHL